MRTIQPPRPPACEGLARVVVLRTPDGPRVEVVELETGTTLGGSFCHLGTSWRITAERPRSRVLVAEPER